MTLTNSNIEALNSKQIIKTNFSMVQTIGICDFKNCETFRISRLGFSVWEAEP